MSNYFDEFFDEGNCSGLGDFEDDGVAFLYCNNSVVTETCMSTCQASSCAAQAAAAAGVQPSVKQNFYTKGTKVMTFLLLAGFAASVDIRMLFVSFRSKGVLVGMACQFVLMPILGFITVLIFRSFVDPLILVMIMLCCCAPGGSYSNWFCSMFNADLALSIAMTTISTVAAAFMMPLNVLFYVELLLGAIEGDSSENSVASAVPYKEMFITLGIVAAGVVTGLSVGYFIPQAEKAMNVIGNIAGITIQVIGLLLNADSCKPFWTVDIYTYILSVLPLPGGIVFGLVIATMLDLPKPQRVAVSIEGAYQNVAVPIVIAASLGTEGRAATTVPVLYALYETFFFAALGIWSVEAGWTLTPKGTSCCTYLWTNYQKEIRTSPLYEKWREENADKFGWRLDDSDSDLEKKDEAKVVDVIVEEKASV
eukprot:snap_masked-scaffold_30-processed-gene-0.24-mRNA-1 protein AED:1.00 eAED:1.00 QI:0/-1/0/0/-1/1/1/0/422